MVATAFTEAMSPAAASAAAPPRLWPISSAGARPAPAMWRAAAIRSRTSLEKPVSSPSLSPRPVKSKRSVATPNFASARLIRTAALEVLSQVKQWAKSANDRAVPSGRSRRAASVWPWSFWKVVRSVRITPSPGGFRAA
jgi:hypothetical protein